MNKELYEKVLVHITEHGHKMTEYGKYLGDIPHYIWYNLQYLPDISGEKILESGFGFLPYGPKFEEQLRLSHAFDIYPFVTEYEDGKVIFLGQVGFLKYNKTAQCFTVSQYPNGYDEVTRNCMPWGKIFKNGIPCNITAKVVCTTVIWYSYCEVADRFSYARNGIIKRTEEAYNMLREYIKHELHFEMLDYQEFLKRNFMTVESGGDSTHINLCGSKLYVIGNGNESCDVRFCYNNETILMEWKDSKTHLSHHASLILPSLSMENFVWMMDRGSKDPGYAVKLCLSGFLARYGVRLTWFEAWSRINTSPMEWMNARTVKIHSFEDVL